MRCINCGDSDGNGRPGSISCEPTCLSQPRKWVVVLDEDLLGVRVGPTEDDIITLGDYETARVIAARHNDELEKAE
jgi:hypothetical protein